MTEVHNPTAARKRRQDHQLENAEDYVELIEEMQRRTGAAHAIDIANHLGISHVTVHKTVKRLKAAGYVSAEPYRAISLTESGLALARESRERHEVTLAFLRALGASEETALNDAEGIEHHVSPELLGRMKAFCAAMEANGAVTKHDLGTDE